MNMNLKNLVLKISIVSKNLGKLVNNNKNLSIHLYKTNNNLLTVFLALIS